MHTFWDNIWKFPKFVFSVFIGFFLTAVYPIFQLSKNKKVNYFLLMSLLLVIIMLYLVLKSMLDYG
uniref:Ycf33 n=1 Tax=Nemalion vermiculare TaxID=935621 RepID=UPI00257CE48B|nr:Ycf33 [Nemalion vermiculare]WGV34473.1 Ycf33 [Nemalion vermiculare]